MQCTEHNPPQRSATFRLQRFEASRPPDEQRAKQSVEAAASRQLHAPSTPLGSPLEEPSLFRAVGRADFCVCPSTALGTNGELGTNGVGTSLETTGPHAMNATLSGWLHRPRLHAQEALRVAPTAPAISLGIRAALATMLPAFAGAALHFPGGLWMSVAGFTVTLVDKGGAYVTRARNMALVSTLGGLAVIAASTLNPHPLGAIFFMFALAFVGGIVRVYGLELAGVGGTITNLAAIALGIPLAAGGSAWTRGLWLFVGGVWSMALALGLWPIRVYGPARAAVGNCWSGLRAHTSLMRSVLGKAGTPEWQVVPQNHAALRNLFEVARGSLAGTRRGQRAESGRGRRLLMLLQVADQAFSSLLALEDVLDAGLSVESGAHRGLRDDWDAYLARLEQTLEDISQAVVKEPLHGPAGTPLRDADEGKAPDEPKAAEPMVMRLGVMLKASRDILNARSEMATPPDRDILGPSQSWRALLWEPLTAHFSFRSVEMRHALRLAVAVATAVAVTQSFHLTRGYWATLTVNILLQPYTSATWVKTTQRVGGTAAGALVAALLAHFTHSPAVILPLVTLLAGVSAALLQVNYALFTFFLTPTFVLLAEANSNSWELTGLRFLNTVIGGLIALGAAFLWPTRERVQLKDQLLAAIDELEKLVDLVFAGLPTVAGIPDAELAERRRGFGLAINNTDAAFQRLLMEERLQPARTEAWMTVLVYLRRLVGGSVTLAVMRAQTSPLPSAALVPLRAYADATLEGVRALMDGSTAALLGKPPEPGAELGPLWAERFTRIEMQLGVLFEAAGRTRD